MQNSSTLRADKNGQPETESFTYRLLQGDARSLQVAHRRGDRTSLVCISSRAMPGQDRISISLMTEQA